MRIDQNKIKMNNLDLTNIWKALSLRGTYSPYVESKAIGKSSNVLSRGSHDCNSQSELRKQKDKTTETYNTVLEFSKTSGSQKPNSLVP